MNRDFFARLTQVCKEWASQRTIESVSVRDELLAEAFKTRTVKHVADEVAAFDDIRLDDELLLVRRHDRDGALGCCGHGACRR